MSFPPTDIPRSVLRGIRRGAPYLALLPVFALVLVQLVHVGSPIVPAADWGMLELNTRSATHFRQFVGPYSPFGFFHPGPAMFYLLAPFYLIAGGRFAGMTFGMSLVSAALLVLLLHVAGRVWGRPALWGTALTVALFVQRFGVAGFRDPWNPFFGVLPLAVGVLLVPLIASTRLRWPLVAQVALVSLALQSHLGSAPALAVLVVATTAAVAWANRGDDLRALLRRGWPAVVTGAALWILPLGQQVLAPAGNLTAIRAHLSHGQSASHPLHLVAKPILLLLAMSPAPLSDRFGPPSPFLPPLDLAAVHLMVAIAVVLASAVAIVRAGRAGERTYLFALGTAGVALAVFALFMTRVQGQLYPFLFAPAMGLSLAIWVTAACFATTRLENHLATLRSGEHDLTPRRRGTVAVAAFVVLVVLTCVPLGSMPSEQHVMSTSGLADLAPVISQLCQGPESDITIVVQSGGPWVDALGFGDALARCGKSVGFSNTLLFIAGERFAPRATGLGVQFTFLNMPAPQSLDPYLMTPTYRVDRVPWPAPGG